jgi:hypothetical protein
MPVSTRNPPSTFSMVARWGLNRCSAAMKGRTAKAAAMKGMPRQNRKVDQPEKVQSGDDDDDACDLAEQAEILGDQLTGEGCRGAKDHEHGGEAEHEGKG